MNYKVIHIFGASGSGTTTLAKEIAARYGYFHMDTDDYFWLKTDPMFTKKREPSERLALIKTDISEHKSVVISGSLSGWGDELMASFDLAIRVVTDTAVRLARLKTREYQRFGDRIRPNGDMYEHHTAFLKWASEYDTGSPDMRSKANHDAWQKLLPCKIVTVNGEQPLCDTIGLLDL